MLNKRSSLQSIVLNRGTRLPPQGVVSKFPGGGREPVTRSTKWNVFELESSPSFCLFNVKGGLETMDNWFWKAWQSKG